MQWDARDLVARFAERRAEDVWTRAKRCRFSLLVASTWWELSELLDALARVNQTSVHALTGGDSVAGQVASILTTPADQPLLIDAQRWSLADPSAALRALEDLSAAARQPVIAAVSGLPTTKSGEPCRTTADLVMPPQSVRVRDVDLVAPRRSNEAATDLLTRVMHGTAGMPAAFRSAVFLLSDTDESIGVDRLNCLVQNPGETAVGDALRDTWQGLSRPAQTVFALAAQAGWVSSDLFRGARRAEWRNALHELVAAGFVQRIPGLSQRLTPMPWAQSVLSPPAPMLSEAVTRGLIDAYYQGGDPGASISLLHVDRYPAMALELFREAKQADHVEMLNRHVGRARVLGPLRTILELDGLTDEERRWGREVEADFLAATGDWQQALTRYAGLRADRATVGQARIATKQVRLEYLRGGLDTALELSRVADDGDRRSQVVLASWRATIMWIRGDFDKAEQSLDEIADQADTDDATALSHLHAARALIAIGRGERAANLFHSMSSLRYAEQSPDYLQLVRIRTNVAGGLMEEGRPVPAAAECELAVEIMERYDCAPFGALTLLHQGEALVQVGRLDEGVATLLEAARIWRQNTSTLVDYALTSLGMARILYRGEFGQAMVDLEAAYQGALARGDSQNLVAALLGLGLLKLSEEPATALVYAERAEKNAFGPQLPYALILRGVALHRLDRPGAQDTLREAITVAAKVSNRRAHAEALITLGVISDRPDPGLIQRGITQYQELGCELDALRGQAALAAALDHEEGVVLAKTVVAAARMAGAWLIADRAQRVLDGAEWSDSAPAEAIAPTLPAQRMLPMTPLPVNDSHTTEGILAIWTLGGFSVVRDGETLGTATWGSRKVRDLMRLLVLRRGARIPRSEVAAALWPGEENAGRRLSGVISTLRGVLDPQRGSPADRYVCADPTAVWLRMDQVDVDLEKFFTLTEQGRRHLAAGDDVQARGSLEAAVALYHGALFADDPDLDTGGMVGDAVRLAAGDLQRSLARLAMRQGRGADAAACWMRALEIDPYDESAHLGLLRTLAGQRRHGEAQRGYLRYRERMREIGVDVLDIDELLGPMRGTSTLGVLPAE